MKLYCNDDCVIATHDDHQNIDPNAYGAGIDVITVPNDTVLEKHGDEPADGEPDFRPYKRPFVSAAEIEEQRIASIKVECGKRIYEVASQETQMNMSGVSAYISSKLDADRSDDEKAHLGAYAMSLGWVDAMRTNVAALIGNAELDIEDDANWPDVPDEVTALAAKF